jgi:hypothetical protein
MYILVVKINFKLNKKIIKITTIIKKIIKIIQMKLNTI